MHFTNWVSNNIFYITLIRSHSPPIISPLFDFFDAQSIWTDLEYLIAIIIKILVLILRMNKIFVLSVANCLFLNIEQKPPKLINDQAVWEKSRKREIERKRRKKKNTITKTEKWWSKFLTVPDSWCWKWMVMKHEHLCCSRQLENQVTILKPSNSLFPPLFLCSPLTCQTCVAAVIPIVNELQLPWL